MQDVGVGGQHRFGAAKWPNIPPRSIRLDITHPRTGATETIELVDPGKVQSPGPVAYSGYPRKAGDAPHVRRDVPLPSGGWGDEVLTWERFIWAEDVRAANPGVNFAHRDGWDLRKLTYYAHDIAKSRGAALCYLVLGAGWHYAPDLTDGYHNGVRLGSNGVTSSTGTRSTIQLGGIVGCGPDTVIALSPDFTPTAEQATMMSTSAAGTNQACTISVDGHAQGVWFANWTGVWTDVTDSAGNRLYWNGIRIKSSACPVVERIGTRGFNPGFKAVPPGETDALAFNSCTRTLERDCLWDGRSLDGVRRSSSMVGHNSSTDCTRVRNIAQYGTAGMVTWWLCTDVLDAFGEVWSTAKGGGTDLSGSGRNFEETAGRIRLLYSRTAHIGKWSTDTANPDKTENTGMFCSLLSTSTIADRNKDIGADLIIWEPWWPDQDYRGFDPKGRIAISAPMNYNGADGTAATITPPMVHKDGRWLTVGDNIDLNALRTTGTRTYLNQTQMASFEAIVSR